MVGLARVINSSPWAVGPGWLNRLSIGLPCGTVREFDSDTQGLKITEEKVLPL